MERFFIVETKRNLDILGNDIPKGVLLVVSQMPNDCNEFTITNSTIYTNGVTKKITIDDIKILKELR